MKRFILTIALLSSALVAGAQTSIEEQKNQGSDNRY